VEDYAEKLAGATAEEREARLLGWIGQLTAGQEPDGSWPGKASAPHEETLDRLVRLVAIQQIALGRRQVSSADSLPAWYQEGIDYLLSRQQEGRWQLAGGPHAGITALCLSALLVKPAARRSEKEKEVIEQATTYLLGEQQPNGSFSGTGTPVYVTSVAVHALLATRREELKPAIRKAMAYLLRMQNVDGRGYTPGDRDYGSLGYGGDNRGDMSNLQLALDALRSAGLPKEDEALEKALVFITRSQNRAASNDYRGTRTTPEGEKEVVPGNDGGGIYYPGNTNAGYRKVGDTLVPRSYGSMTWALLKCYILCDVERSNPRVQDAWKWIQENYTLEENPGFSPELKKKNAHYQGLFYYYLTMARTLSLMGIDRISAVVRETPAEREARRRRNEKIEADPEDDREPVQAVRRRKKADGTVETWVYRPRHWRRELLARLKELQRPDGSWVNDKASRWMEGNPDLATAYALLAAAHALDHPNLPGIR
jgi:squalene-hopene/tetraprenyl-beta-curcumene cyclase